MPAYCGYPVFSLYPLLLEYETMKIAYIFSFGDGWYVCDYSGLLDISGKCCWSKRDAIAASRKTGQWTHYIVSGSTKLRKMQASK